MSASLVGSEMCIRDSPLQRPRDRAVLAALPLATRPRARTRGRIRALIRAVSYTHLTLPTICSV
eukprot:4611190-Alexandrium_andersonii.AAC.1